MKTITHCTLYELHYLFLNYSYFFHNYTRETIKHITAIRIYHICNYSVKKKNEEKLQNIHTKFTVIDTNKTIMH